MKKKLFSFSLLVFAFAALLTACSAPQELSTNDDGLVIDKTKNYEYVIIYGKDAGDTVVHQASLLCKELKEKCKVEAYTQSDWEYRPNDSLENQGSDKVIEILLGTTDRQLSVDTYNSFTDKNEYVIKAQEDSLVIAATTEQLLVDAVNKFKEEYLEQKALKIVIPYGTEIRNSNYYFFDIVKNGSSTCTIVIPDNASTRIRNMATSISNKINSLCGTNIKVSTESKVKSTEGCILIGNLEDADSKRVMMNLDVGQSVIKYANSKIIIAGYNDTSILNGIFSFMGNIVMKHDKYADGTPYIYFPTELEITDTWMHIAPSVPGGNVIDSSQNSSNLFTVVFEDVEQNEFNNYEELLKNLEFIVTSRKTSDDNSTVSLILNYNHVDSTISIDATLNMLYTVDTKTLEMTISYTVELFN